MPNDKNSKKLWVLLALIVLVSIIVLPIAFDQILMGGDDSERDKSTPTPATTTTTTSTPESGTQTSTPSQSQDQVRFTVYVDEGNIKECGWTCREIPATLKNSGDKTAHNVNVNVRFYCDGDRMDVNGKEYVSLNLGNLEPGESETRTKEVDVGFGGGLCIQNNGARIIFTVISDEKTMKLEETYNP